MNKNEQLLELQKQELLQEIARLGYDSLRYSIFNEHRLAEWETRIEFNYETKEYEVFSTMNRASIGKAFTFNNFNDAQKNFLRNLELTVFRYQNYVKEGMEVPYSSPLWDKADD